MSSRAMVLRTMIVVLFLVASPLSGASVSADELDKRWLYLQLNLQVQDNVPKTLELMKRAAKAGYHGVVIADYKLNILDRVPEHYFKHVAEVRQLADTLGLELIPTVAPMGYSEGLLAHNPNLAEGIPVREARFVIHDGVARLQSQLVSAVPGGGFDEHKNHTVPGWSFQNGAGQFSFVDNQVKHSGTSSLRWENLKSKAAPSGNARVSRVVKVQPWHQYHASVWIKTNQFESARDVKLFAMRKEGRVLSHFWRRTCANVSL
jgi:hypothetical protein